ncbi:uncharacterized protein LOC110830162 [Zootermopsis nevadensis]|uniref:UBZ4-type domain-containing protein n=1 Tax=Zootermopsis nevadensis TaxID=136037 RepID=A0A067R9H8_ZOONE|nr:uncharacterized protein LOC110830162 [Zootermopsis nevadensis]KDR19242.1 hypothetical protein L798_06297 [Zootermopsis nevadensis]
MFITNPSKRTVTAESQLDAADDLFDSLLEGHKKEDDKGPLCKDADNSNLNFTSVDRQGSMKRKSESSDDQTFDQEEKSDEPQEKRVASSSWLMVKKDESPPIAVKRKKLCQVMSYAEPAHNYEDLEGDFEPSEKFMRRRDGVKSYVKKKNLRKTSSKQSHSLNKDRDMDDDVNIFDDLDNAEGVGGDRGSRQETETIRPGPIKLRKQGRRRLFHQSQVEMEKRAEAEEKEREDPPMADITVMYKTKSSDDKEEESELLPCPICRNTFPAKDIEAHASECNEYCEEEIPPDELHISGSSSSPEMGLQSTRGSISEQCWRDYENGKGFQGHHSSTYKRGQQRPQTRQDELEAPLSPIRCFVPISAQHDSEIDYLHQFRIATSIKQRARQTRAGKRGKKRKRKVQVKTTKGRKKARSGGKEKVSSCAKTFEDSW